MDFQGAYRFPCTVTHTIEITVTESSEEHRAYENALRNVIPVQQQTPRGTFTMYVNSIDCYMGMCDVELAASFENS